VQGDNALRSAIESNDADISSLQDKDTTHGEVHQDLKNEDASIRTAINFQKNKRVQGDNALRSAIESNDADIESLNTSVADEEAARKKADANLRKQSVKAVKSSKARDTALGAQVAAAKADIEANDADIASLTADITAEEAARKKADKNVVKSSKARDTALGAKVAAANADIASNDADIESLTASITAEEAARRKADKNVATASKARDAHLRKKLTAEIAVNADSIVTLASKIAAEEDARKTEDSKLGTRVANLRRFTIVEDKKLKADVQNARNSIDTDMGDMKSELLAKADAVVKQMQDRAAKLAASINGNALKIVENTGKVQVTQGELDDFKAETQLQAKKTTEKLTEVEDAIAEVKVTEYKRVLDAESARSAMELALNERIDDTDSSMAKAVKDLEELVAQVQQTDVQARVTLGKTLRADMAKSIAGVAKARQDALGAQKRWTQAQLKQKTSVAQVEELIKNASAQQAQATDKKLADAEANMKLAWKEADEAQKKLVDAKTGFLEKELKALKDLQLPELSKLLAIVDGKILAQSQANAKAWAAADSGIQTNLDTYKQAQLTELQSVRNDIKATADNAAAAVDVVQKNLNTVARNLDNDVTLAEQQITATRKALEQRINRVTRDKDVGCKPGTYLVADTTDSKVDTCVSCPAGYYCTGGKANKRKLSHGGNCASVNTHGRTLTASPHLTADCKSSVVASSSSFDNSNVKRCDRDIQCKYSYSYSASENYVGTCSSNYCYWGCSSCGWWCTSCGWQSCSWLCWKSRTVTKYADVLY